MIVIVTGVNGQLGHDVANELISRGHNAIGCDITEPVDIKLDITNKKEVLDTISQHEPDAVIHCAAWTAVDEAEEEENIEKVFAINTEGTRNIAEACKKNDCKMIYISTDYVFNGEGNIPWTPDCKNYAPLNIYGKSKLEGELAVTKILNKYYIVRIAWAFGNNGRNFIKTMLNIGKNRDEVRVVYDQIGTPTYTIDLARLIVDMVERDRYGYYHATNEGEYISWYDLTCEIFRQAGYSTKATPVSTAEYGLSKAARPFNSRLNRRKLIDEGFTPLPEWKDALARYLREISD